MDTIYKKITDTFKANEQVFIDRGLPVIRQIDINYGQPDNPEGFEVFMPSIFIGWQISQPNQNEANILTLDFHVLQEPGAHTEQYSERITEGLEYIYMLKTVKYILNKLRADNTTGLSYVGERPNITPYFRYHIVSYQCFIDNADESLTKGGNIGTELTGYTKDFKALQKVVALPTDIDTY